MLVQSSKCSKIPYTMPIGWSREHFLSSFVPWARKYLLVRALLLAFISPRFLFYSVCDESVEFLEFDFMESHSQTIAGDCDSLACSGIDSIVSVVDTWTFHSTLYIGIGLMISCNVE